MARHFKDGGVPFCWQCGKQLQRRSGGFYFAEVEDPLGNKHRVHKDCEDAAVADGNKKVTSNYARR